MMPRQRPSLYESQKGRLATYAHAKANFDLDRIDEATAASGWHIDHYERDMPAEAPGPPVPGGSFEAACQVLRNYSFPPPSLITGIFAPDTALEDRVMVLRGHFLIFNFWFGVRVGRVISEVRAGPNAELEEVWGYSYHTLEGHFEKGRITFTVHKGLRTGQVQMRIDAVSQTGYISNPFYRLGFRIFGRTLQRRFAHGSLERTREQVEDMLRRGVRAPAPSETPVQVVDKEDLPDEVAESVDEHVEQRLRQGEGEG